MSYTLYSLRIGGRTLLIYEAMDHQFCEFLGSGKSPEASVDTLGGSCRSSQASAKVLF